MRRITCFAVGALSAILAATISIFVALPDAQNGATGDLVLGVPKLAGLDFVLAAALSAASLFFILEIGRLERIRVSARRVLILHTSVRNAVMGLLSAGLAAAMAWAPLTQRYDLSDPKHFVDTLEAWGTGAILLLGSVQQAWRGLIQTPLLQVDPSGILILSDRGWFHGEASDPGANASWTDVVAVSTDRWTITVKCAGNVPALKIPSYATNYTAESIAKMLNEFKSRFDQGTINNEAN